MPPRPKWVMLVDHLAAQIASGELAPGDQLPSTSRLCHDHRVSASVVRSAMIALKTWGLVEGVHGLGVYVCQPPGDQDPPSATATNASPTSRRA